MPQNVLKVQLNACRVVQKAIYKEGWLSESACWVTWIILISRGVYNNVIQHSLLKG